MKRTSRCPKCQSLEIARAEDGWTIIPTGEREFTIYLCLDCGYEERYVNAPRDRGYTPIRTGEGPFR